MNDVHIAMLTVTGSAYSTLTVRQLALMLALAESEPQSTRGMAQALAISKPAITRACNSLEQQNLINRDIDGKDARGRLLTLTTKGVEFIQTVAPRASRLSRVA